MTSWSEAQLASVKEQKFNRVDFKVAFKFKNWLY